MMGVSIKKYILFSSFLRVEFLCLDLEHSLKKIHAEYGNSLSSGKWFQQ